MKVELTQGQINGLIGVERVVVKATVYGVGFNDVQFQIRVGGKEIWQSGLWRSMLQRCFDRKLKAKYPTYQNVTCCDEWLRFSSFLMWCNKEVAYKGKPKEMDLDKDLLFRGNKVYSPETCAFVPKEVNTLFGGKIGSANGEWPMGVYLDKRCGKFKASIRCSGKPKHLGGYDTPEEAFAAYKIAKEAQIKLVALRHKASLKPAVFESLMNWEIEP